MGSDNYDEMHRFLPGDDICERLLSGRLSPLDAPDPLRGVAALFEAAAGPAAPQELARKGQVVAAAMAEVLSSHPQLQTRPSRRKAMLSKVLTAKFAAAATVAAFGLGTAAAAATGALPGQTSHANSHAASGLATAAAAAGSSANHGSSNHATSSGGTTSAKIPSTGPANSQAQYGLCTAFLQATRTQAGNNGASSPPPSPQYNSTAFKALIAENNGVSGTTTYCRGVVATHASTSGNAAAGQPSDTGKPANTGRPANTGQPADTGKPATTGRPAGAGQSSDAGAHPSATGTTHGQAPISPPSSGGTGTADTASGGASDAGASTSGAASSGASTAGSGNAPAHP